MRKPKTPVAKVPINEEAFKEILKSKGISIREFGNSNDLSFCERTLRYALKSGKIRPDYLQEVADKLGVSKEELSVQNPAINKKKAKKEKPFMELTREQFNETFNKVWNEANKDGYDKGYINGLALASAYIYKHVEDLAVKSNNYDIVSSFNYAFEKAKEKIAAEKRQA